MIPSVLHSYSYSSYLTPLISLIVHKSDFTQSIQIIVRYMYLLFLFKNWPFCFFFRFQRYLSGGDNQDWVVTDLHMMRMDKWPCRDLLNVHFISGQTLKENKENQFELFDFVLVLFHLQVHVLVKLGRSICKKKQKL